MIAFTPPSYHHHRVPSPCPFGALAVGEAADYKESQLGRDEDELIFGDNGVEDERKDSIYVQGIVAFPSSLSLVLLYGILGRKKASKYGGLRLQASS